MFHVNNEEGINKRNTMHNRLVTDAFIPAGGRPGTIDISNYKKYLQQDGSPSSPLIVEGANLFITGDARRALYDEGGVVIVKDSSANKCGVITSSYEICAAMLLNDDAFLANKEEIVAEVIEKLRELAKMEAELLFQEFGMNKCKFFIYLFIRKPVSSKSDLKRPKLLVQVRYQKLVKRLAIQSTLQLMR